MARKSVLLLSSPIGSLPAIIAAQLITRDDDAIKLDPKENLPTLLLAIHTTISNKSEMEIALTTNAHPYLGLCDGRLIEYAASTCLRVKTRSASAMAELQ